MNRYTNLLRGVALALAALTCNAGAAGFPDRPIKLVVPFPAGGGTDITARKLARELTTELGQSVYVENRAGATGNIGASVVARAPADGYTLLMTAAPFAIAPALFKDLSFDPVKDFTAITEIATVPLLLVTRKDSPLHTVADLVAAAKKPGADLTYATFGVGSPPHLVGEKIQQLAGIKLRQIPYKGGQAALPQIISGQIDIGILDVVSMAPLVNSGRLRALAITGPVRSPSLPSIPTLSQQGIHFDAVGWYGLFGPAGLPPAVRDKLNSSVNKILARADMRKLIIDGGSIPISPPTSAAQWQSRFDGDVQLWGKIARDSGAVVN
jgi:tripartite-type tricarboxylate transporter receptor subunit TctC